MARSIDTTIVATTIRSEPVASIVVARGAISAPTNSNAFVFEQARDALLRPGRDDRDGAGNSETDTRRAADYLGLSHRTLDGYSVSGAGPAFHRFGNRVRYRRSDLDEWAANRRATTTAEADRLASA